MRISRWLGWLAVLLVFTGRVPLAAQRVDRIQVVPLTMKLTVGEIDSAKFKVLARDASEVPVSTDLLTVVNPRQSVAVVVRQENYLIVTAVSPGSTIIEVRSGEVQPGRLRVEVVDGRSGSPRNSSGSAQTHGSTPAAALPPSVSAVELRIPVAELRLAVGERDRIRAEALDANHNVIPNAPIRFLLFTPNVIALDSLSGTVTAQSPERAFLGVSVPGAPTQTVSVNVEASAFVVHPDTLRVLPANRDTLRLMVPSLERAYRGPITWTSTNPAVLSVDASSGAITGVSPTTEAVSVVSVRAAAGGRDTYGTVIVMQPPPQDGGLLFSIGTPRTLLLMPIGDSRTLRGVAVDGQRDTMYQLPLSWELASNSGVAILDTAVGRISARRQGVDTLIGRLLIRLTPSEFRWPLRVVGGGVSFGGSRFGIRLGANDSFPVAMLDSTGLPSSDPVTVEWTAQPATVLLHRGHGLFEATGAGRAEIIARTPWDSSTRATIFVPPDLVYSHVGKTAEGRGYAELRGIDIRTGATRSLSGPEAIDDQPAISPDRTRIAFVRRAAPGDQNVWVMDSDGRDAVNVTPDSVDERGPFWSTDGRALFYIAPISGQGERLFIAEADGRNPRVFLNEPFSVASAATSPDGRFLTYSTLRAGKYDLFQVPLATTGPLAPIGGERQLLSVPNHDLLLPQYARATGDLFFIDRERGGKNTQTLMMLAASARQVQPVSPPGLKILSFAVGPDGLQVVAVAAKPGSTARELKTALYFLDVRQVATAPPVPWREEAGVTFATPTFAP